MYDLELSITLINNFNLRNFNLLASVFSIFILKGKSF